MIEIFTIAGIPCTAFFPGVIDHGGEGLHIIIMTQILRRNVLAVIAGSGFLRITAADLRLNAEDIRCYYALAGVSITPEDAHSIEGYTEGWVIAVCLQLRSFLETGVFSCIQFLALIGALHGPFDGSATGVSLSVLLPFR